VRVLIYDVIGREVETLVNARQAGGTYRIQWNARDFHSGVYFYRLEAGDLFETRKMILME